MAVNKRSSQYLSTGSWTPKNNLLMLGLILLSLPCITVTYSVQRQKRDALVVNHVDEVDNEVVARKCFYVECPPGHTIKKCEKNGSRDQCVQCPENMEQLYSTSSRDIRSCTLKVPYCAEDSELVELANGTKVCQCKPDYCGHYPHCTHKDCAPGSILDQSTCNCRAESTTAGTTTTPPPVSASPAKVISTNSSTSKMLTILVPAVSQSSSPAPTEPPLPPIPVVQYSGLTPGAIFGIVLGVVGCIVLALALFLGRGCIRRALTSHQSQTILPQGHLDPAVTQSETRPTTVTLPTVVINNAAYVQFGQQNTIINGNGHANGHTNGHANGYANGHTNGFSNGSTANGHGLSTFAPSAPDSDQGDSDNEGDTTAESLLKDKEGRRLPIQAEGQALLEGRPPPSPASVHSDRSETLVKGHVDVSALRQV